MAYTSYSKGGPGVSLALTKDFRIFERYGVIMSADDKDAALLPYRIGGLWALIHRPMPRLELTSGFPTLPICVIGVATE